MHRLTPFLAIALVSCDGDDSATPGADGGPAGPEGGSDALANGDGGGTPDSGGPGSDGGQSLTEFPSTSTMYRDISGSPVDSKWGTLQQVLAGGWGGPFQ